MWPNLLPELPTWFDQLGLMAWPLALCALVALALCFERFFFCLGLIFDGDSRYQCLVAVLTRHKDSPKKIRDDKVSILLAELKPRYYGSLKALRLIGTLSPMLGLLGTMLGIIAAFQVIAAHSGPISPALIANGLWEAMLTTVVGLMIALFSLLMAHLFRHIADSQLQRFCLELNRLSLSFEERQND